MFRALWNHELQQDDPTQFIIIDDNMRAPSMWSQYYETWQYCVSSDDFLNVSRGPAPEHCYERRITKNAMMAILPQALKDEFLEFCQTLPELMD